MSFSITIQDDVTPVLNQFRDRLQGRNINPVIARAAANTVRAHLFDLDRQRINKFGAARSHFYSQAAKSVHHEIGPDSVAVHISHIGAAQRYYGGTIRRLRAKALTIPACAEAYGKRAREFNHLMFTLLGGKGGKPALVEADRTAIKISKKTGKVKAEFKPGGKVYYWLVPKAVQQKDPFMLPTTLQMTAALTNALEDYLTP